MRINMKFNHNFVVFDFLNRKMLEHQYLVTYFLIGTAVFDVSSIRIKEMSGKENKKTKERKTHSR